MGQGLGLGRADGVGGQRRDEQVRQGELPGQPLDLLGRERMAVQPEAASRFEGLEVAGVHGDPGGRGDVLGRPRQPLGHRIAGVDDDRPELHARPILQGVGRLDGLADRHLLGQGDQDHLAPGGVAQQLDDLLRLAAQRSPPGRIDQTGGRGEEGDGVAGGRGVDHDQIGHFARVPAA